MADPEALERSVREWLDHQPPPPENPTDLDELSQYAYEIEEVPRYVWEWMAAAQADPEVLRHGLAVIAAWYTEAAIDPENSVEWGDSYLTWLAAMTADTLHHVAPLARTDERARLLLRILLATRPVHLVVPGRTLRRWRSVAGLPPRPGGRPAVTDEQASARTMRRRRAARHQAPVAFATTQ